MCKLQSWNNRKQQENEDHSVEPGDPDDAIEEQVDVWHWCLIIMFERRGRYHDTHMCMLQTCGKRKPQEEDSF